MAGNVYEMHPGMTGIIYQDPAYAIGIMAKNTVKKYFPEWLSHCTGCNLSFFVIIHPVTGLIFGIVHFFSHFV